MGLKVLVVDDSATTRRYYSSILTRAGYEVDAAANGYEALEKLLQDDYSLFIVDVNMPKMSGYEFVRALRGSGAHEAKPVVIITTEKKREEREEGYRAGANMCLSKPVSPEQLLAVAQVLAGRG